MCIYIYVRTKINLRRRPPLERFLSTYYSKSSSFWGHLGELSELSQSIFHPQGFIRDIFLFSLLWLVGTNLELCHCASGRPGILRGNFCIRTLLYFEDFGIRFLRLLGAKVRIETCALVQAGAHLRGFWRVLFFDNFSHLHRDVPRDPLRQTCD